MSFMPSLESILEDPSVLEILIDNFDRVYVERGGQLVDVASPYVNNDDLMAELVDLAASMGRHLDESHPIVDLRLEDASRVHIVIPPIALTGPSLVIRKFPAKSLTIADLLGFGSLSEDIVTFIRACVEARVNLVMAGGTSSGKTTVMNIICEMIPPSERIITVEAMAALRFKHNRRVVLEARPANLEGRGEVSLTDLIVSTVKMRPDRIILGEAQGGEVLHLLQAMNTGHDGSMLSMHATGIPDVLARLETMASMGNPTIPLLTIREQLAKAVQVIVEQQRLPDGSRRIVRITEVMGMAGDSIQTQDIFEFYQTGIEGERIVGHFTATGNVPKFIRRLKVPMSLFTPR
ncbi:MAG: CpaF family protein [Anaerolineales bacterium]|nr:CpaF family protein [Anaerolineales bacterium]